MADARIRPTNTEQMSEESKIDEVARTSDARVTKTDHEPLDQVEYMHDFNDYSNPKKIKMNGVSAACMTADGEHVVAAGKECKQLSIFKVSTDDHTLKLVQTIPTKNPVNSALFTSDGKYLVAREKDAVVSYKWNNEVSNPVDEKSLERSGVGIVRSPAKINEICVCPTKPTAGHGGADETPEPFFAMGTENSAKDDPAVKGEIHILLASHLAKPAFTVKREFAVSALALSQRHSGELLLAVLADHGNCLGGSGERSGTVSADHGNWLTVYKVSGVAARVEGLKTAAATAGSAAPRRMRRGSSSPAFIASHSLHGLGTV